MRHRPVLLLAGVLLAGCATVKVEPIHITVDINIKVDQALDDFFRKPAEPVAAPAPAIAPATTPEAGK
jgi:hypothetical protein